jgi:hypothetical protein
MRRSFQCLRGAARIGAIPGIRVLEEGHQVDAICSKTDLQRDKCAARPSRSAEAR